MKKIITLFLLFLYILCSFSFNKVVLKGYVFDRKTKFPIKDAQVEIGGKVTFTDKDGYYEFKNLVVGNLIVKINAKKFLNYVDLVKVDYGVNSRNFYLEPEPVLVRVRGVVENADTALGVENATVAFDNLMATTDENGNFYFEKIKPGKYIVRIKHEDYEKFIDEVEVTNADINNFKFELNPLVRYGKIIGEIRNEDGDLVGNAQIIIGNNQPIEVSGGKFVAENIIRGKYKLIVYADGYEPYEDRIIVKDLTRVRIILKRDTSFRYKSFISKRNKGKSEEKEIPATKGYGSVEGMIRDEDTLKPIKGVTVSLAGQYMVTGEDGMYYFNKIIPGQYSMSIIAKGYGVYAADIYVKEGYGIFNISLKKNENESVLYGKVYEKRTNRPIEGARVYVGRDLCKTDKSGFFSFKVKQDDYVELKVYIGKVLMYKKIVYIKSNRVKHDVFLEVE